MYTLKLSKESNPLHILSNLTENFYHLLDHCENVDETLVQDAITTLIDVCESRNFFKDEKAYMRLRFLQYYFNLVLKYDEIQALLPVA